MPLENSPMKADILVVDDTPANLKLLVRILSENGYKARPAPNGRLALEGARAEAPDLILLDINMPEMSGFTVCESLKKDPATADIPVIFISVRNDIDDKSQAFALGAVDYLTKPFNEREVLLRVETHIRLRRLNAELAEKNESLTREIEQREHLTQEMARREEQMRQAYKTEALNTLTGGLAHDFNNIFTVILGNLEMTLEDIPEDHLLRTNITEAFNACMRGRDIIHNLVRYTLSCMEHPVTFPAVPILSDAVNLIQSSKPPRVIIRTIVGEKDIAIKGVPSQIHRLIYHLCQNAIQALPEAGGEIRIALKKVIPDGPHAQILLSKSENEKAAELIVSDSGKGIAPEHMDRIFDPYFTTQEFGRGAGLGLTVVRGIVKAHGGIIEVDSTLGKGAAFRVLLPLA